MLNARLAVVVLEQEHEQGDEPLEGGDELLFVAVTEVEDELREQVLHPRQR